MPDYKKMYAILFCEMTKAISTLQKAQQETEDIYIADDFADNLTVIPRGNDVGDKDNDKHPSQE